MIRCFAVLLIVAGTAAAQDLQQAVKAMGAADLRTIEYAGTGATFTLGQNVNPNAPWPRVEAKSYRRAIDYGTPASREEIERPQGRTAQFVSGNTAWNMTGANPPAPAPAAVAERLTQIWITPHGFLKAALANRAAVKGRTVSSLTASAASPACWTSRTWSRQFRPPSPTRCWARCWWRSPTPTTRISGA
jgi:hypothetical protein